MAIFDAALTALAFCWELRRRDGVRLGFTTHDRDLTVDGLVYRAAPGMLPSAVTLREGFGGEGPDVSGAITSDAITAEDLADGRWDGAAVRLFLADWEAGGETVVLLAGELGDVGLEGDGFEAELRGLAARLERPAVEQASPDCRARLGDKRCRVDMAARVRVTRVAAVGDESTLDVEEAPPGEGLYAFGRLRWLGGANSGLETGLLASRGTRLTLRDPPPLPPAAGDLVEIEEGCDKTFATCRSRFANADNFRGEPHLPGMDLLTRYPGAA
ncbi:MAG: DUF2163 domain-containing protein [Alphaproteobacteria bacterium]|nr:DUF2163 domain-containing protein [Alphaproteobacteria bacterium]MBV9371122.1 DUF2163 domain-containing protein [Alphaproteobacteria bacterium]MBV9900774.1 DUF2163 domain-containing protein [Alphaproteobacteria bacterium]